MKPRNKNIANKWINKKFENGINERKWENEVMNEKFKNNINE